MFKSHCKDTYYAVLHIEEKHRCADENSQWTKNTAEELYARDKHERNLHIAKRLQVLVLLRRGTPIR